MLVLETAVVRRFFTTTKKYGFAKVLDDAGRETGEEIYLHIDRGEWVGIVEDESGEPDLDFVGRKSPKGYYMPKPKNGGGDRIMFIRDEQRRSDDVNDKAAKWAYEWQYKKAANELKARLDQ